MKTDYLQEQFIGKTFSDKINEEIADYLQERKFSVLGYIPRPGTIAMVHTLDDGELKQLGGSDPFDVINDNFGKWLAAMHMPVSGLTNNPNAIIGGGNNPVDVSGANLNVVFFYNNVISAWWNERPNGGPGKMQIGSGLTPPDQADFNIETPFANGGPEDVEKLIVGQGAYNPGPARVSTGTNIGPTVGSGTINETALSQEWRGGTRYLLSHDAISPAVNFGIGETLFVQYFFQI